MGGYSTWGLNLQSPENLYHTVCVVQRLSLLKNIFKFPIAMAIFIKTLILSSTPDRYLLFYWILLHIYNSGHLSYSDHVGLLPHGKFLSPRSGASRSYFFPVNSSLTIFLKFCHPFLEKFLEIPWKFLENSLKISWKFLEFLEAKVLKLL